MIETEIERKWLIDIEATKKILVNELPIIQIKQAYLVSKENIATRVRKLDTTPGYKMTVKTGTGLERKEFSTEIPDEVGDVLVENLDTVILKDRIIYKLGELTVELDCFYGNLLGLFVAEIEFPSVEAAESFTDIPTWFGKEVTEDSRYQNSNLAITQEIPHD